MTDRDRSAPSEDPDADGAIDHGVVSHSAASARSILGVATSLIGADERVPLFPTEPDVPRRRRPYDVSRLAVTAAAFVLLGWLASNDPDLDRRIATLLSSLPDWIRTLSWAAFSASGIAAVLLLVASAGARGSRRSLFRDLVVAGVLAVVIALVSGRIATGAWPNVLPEFVGLSDRAAYPTLRPTLVLIVASVLGPYVNAQMQRAMRWMVVATTTTPLLLGLTTLTGMIGAVTLGLLVVAGVRLAFGSPEGLPSTARLGSMLANLGVPVDEVAYAHDQPGTVGIATARTIDGRQLDLKIYSVDASSQQRAERIWRALWYRRAGPSPRAGRIEQAQHEALATLTAREAGVDVPALVGVGQDTNGDVLLLSLAADGASLDGIDAPSDDDLVATWIALFELHRTARLTHGSITPTTVRRHGDRTQFTDLSDASLFPTAQQTAADVVAMLASHALVVAPIGPSTR